MTTRRVALALRTLAAALLLSLATGNVALAWGAEGHRVIADIAEQLFQPETERQVRELLAIENKTTLAEVSTWADEIRPQRRETAPWHFVDIPIYPPAGTPAAYDAQRDCPTGNCVVAKIGEYVAKLHDKTLDDRTRLEALKFVVHFVGDIHQPLHCADDHDRGGNDVHVRYQGRMTNLHAVWDTAILAPAVNGDEREYAGQLMAQINNARIAAWQDGTPADWANESYSFAKMYIYGYWPHAGDLPDTYGQNALPIVNEILETAGVRLAGTLNEALP